MSWSPYLMRPFLNLNDTCAPKPFAVWVKADITSLWTSLDIFSMTWSSELSRSAAFSCQRNGLFNASSNINASSSMQKISLKTALTPEDPFIFLCIFLGLQIQLAWEWFQQFTCCLRVKCFRKIDENDPSTSTMPILCPPLLPQLKTCK